MFRINPSKTSREEKHVPNTVSASTRTKPINVSQPPVISKKDVNSDLNDLSSTGIDNTKTRRPQPRSNTKHDRVPFVSKSSRSKNKKAEVEEHHKNLLLSKNNKHISSTSKVHENCDDNEIFKMFTQEEQYTELLEPIPESHQVPQHDNDVISEDTSVEQGGETVEQHLVNFEETRALYESLYQNLAIKVEKFNSVNRKLKETNADMTTELARYKNQKRCFEISQEKYDKLERCYQQSVYQEQCLSKKINALHLSSGKQIMTLNKHISALNKQLSKEKSTVSFLLEEKKRLKKG
nr:hypothetical protein [Tanacetum cinerariifolium]